MALFSFAAPERLLRVREAVTVGVNAPETRPFTMVARSLPVVRVPTAWIAALRCGLNLLSDQEERGAAQIEVAARPLKHRGSTPPRWIAR